MTSSPELTPSAISASRSASDPEAQPRAKREPTKAAISASSCLTSGPMDELLALEDLLHSGPDFLFHRGVFRLQIEEGEEQLRSAGMERVRLGKRLSRGSLHFPASELAVSEITISIATVLGEP